MIKIWEYGHIPTNLALGRRRQETQEFEAGLNYRRSYLKKLNVRLEWRRHTPVIHSAQ